MEIRARYFLIGLFVLAVIAGVVGFVYWLYNTGGLVQRTAYRVQFTGSVSGLSQGSQVLFNGIQVGEVTSLRLSPDDPADVIATIAIDARAPVRTDTHVGMSFEGLTGTAAIALAGGSPDGAAPPAGEDGSPPLLVADPAALSDLTQSARDALNRLTGILDENADSLHDAITNIDTFSQALARNSGSLDTIVEGLVRLTGGGSSQGQNVTYDLTAPADFLPIDRIPQSQLTVPQPSAVVVLDTQRILVRQVDGGIVPVFDNVRWADSLPLLVQSRIIRGFENAGYPRVGTDFTSVSGDYQLVIDLRAFDLAAAPAPLADVALSVKVLDAAGSVVDAKVFTASEAAATADDAAVVAAAFDRAFGRVATDTIVWALATMASDETAGGGNPPPPVAPPPDGSFPLPQPAEPSQGAGAGPAQ